MGTSGAYTGAGGTAGKEISEGLSDWVDSLPSAAEDDGGATDEGPPSESEASPLPPKAMSGLMGLLRPRSGSGSADGPGGGGGGAAGGSGGGGTGRTRSGSGRSSQRLSSVGGRAAAGAYAFAGGDIAGLERLGLDYAELSALGDPFEVSLRIIDAVCGEVPESNLESDEERNVAADVVDWILIENQDGADLTPEEIARYTIATIIIEVLSTELAVELRDRHDGVRKVAEDELRAAATAVADRAELTTTGATDAELSNAVEKGIETLRGIYGGSQ